MGQAPDSSRKYLRRKAWTIEEDSALMEYINAHGEGQWPSLPKRAGLERSGKSCRLRWVNYLRPGIKRGKISPEEEELIKSMHRLLGNRGKRAFIGLEFMEMSEAFNLNVSLSNHKKYIRMEQQKEKGEQNQDGKIEIHPPKNETICINVKNKAYVSTGMFSVVY
eukprot:PITA_13781